MTAQYFPSVEDILSLLMDELPEGVYATDRADDPNEDNRSYTSAELRAHAEMLALAYENLSDINDNKFITTANSVGLTLWENDLFSKKQDATLSIETRRQNLFAKLRSVGGINYPTIKNIVAGVLGDIPFEILPYSGMNHGAWLLDESELGGWTWLSKIDPIYGYLLDNSLDWAAAGITQEQMEEMQEVAYTYEVRIYGNATASMIDLLDQQLTAFEPARSTHIIRNNEVAPI